MLPGQYRTISGALYRAPNLEHNNRDHIPWNANGERADKNVIFVDGTKGFTLEKAYEKLFQESYERWLEKEHRKSRAKDAPPTYYEKIELDKQKHLSYEVIWQIGDMDDTGYDTNPMDAKVAEEILLDFAEYLMKEVPNVTYLSKERIANSDWKPPFEAGVIITNFAFNGDESTPHLHMTFVPYSDHCSRGQQTQNALAQTFERMGYKTTMKQAVDEYEELVWQETPVGKKPQMVRNAYGAVEWIEEQKNWIADRMKERKGWERLFKGKNERGELKFSDYRRERAAEKALEAEMEMERTENALVTVRNQATEEIDNLDRQITDKKMDLAIQNVMVGQGEESLKRLDVKLAETNRKVEIAEELYREMATQSGNTSLFDRAVDLVYENEQLKSKVQTLQEMLNQAYEFMKKLVVGSRNALEVFMEQVEGAKEWIRSKVVGVGR